MFSTLFIVLLLGLVFFEALKGLSANGTPPILQKLPGQMQVAYYSWSSIGVLRIIGGIALAACLVLAAPEMRLILIAVAVPLVLIWFGIYWLFNRIWVGRIKFPALSTKVFVGQEDNELDPNLQVIGLDYKGEQKAFPVNMVTFHHQIVDSIADLPVWVTYCGLCRSGRVYDLNVDGMTLDFTLVGAIAFNATFEDNQTGTWWQQETGEAAMGKLKGRVLEDVGFEQMTLANWLEKHPSSQILQYDPNFTRRYNFVAKLQNFEATKPAWHMQETPSLVMGLEIDGVARGYDWEQLKTSQVVMDDVNDAPIVLAVSPDQSSALAYSREHDGEVLAFTATDAGMTDSQTGSTWNWFGTCVSGALEGQKLTPLQSYQQYVRSWITFHPNTTFYDFG